MESTLFDRKKDKLFFLVNLVLVIKAMVLVLQESLTSFLVMNVFNNDIYLGPFEEV
jgi:hypothetical protein